MNFDKPLLEGVLIKRYKRFLADVELRDGCKVTAHTPNTGSMRGCDKPGSRVWLSDSRSSSRKYPLTWELLEPRAGVLVGINTTLSNTLVREAIEHGVVRELKGYGSVRSEVCYGVNSRVDLLLEGGRGGSCYVEVKNVTLVEKAMALFPDAVSVRGTKHLHELARVAATGTRAVIFYCVQREDATEVHPAEEIDPKYAHTLRQVLRAGVEALAYRAEVSTRGVELHTPLPVNAA